MEFYNVKMLPEGLPEIITQFVPYECYDNTKVIIRSRGERDKHGHKSLGRFRGDSMTENWLITLWPTMIAFHRHGLGTFSFTLWQEFLRVALHEVGHLATIEQYEMVGEAYEENYEIYSYIEQLANDWQKRAFAKIISRDPRLGQPPGRLTGYPGILAYKRRSGSFNRFDYERVVEWRAMQCDAQVTLADIVRKLADYRVFNDYCEHYKIEDGQRQKIMGLYLSRIRRRIHKAARELGINRHYTNPKGHKYLMFNLAEAEAVYNVLRDRKWPIEKPGGDILELPGRRQIKKEQLGPRLRIDDDLPF